MNGNLATVDLFLSSHLPLNENLNESLFGVTSTMCPYALPATKNYLNARWWPFHLAYNITIANPGIDNAYSSHLYLSRVSILTLAASSDTIYMRWSIQIHSKLLQCVYLMHMDTMNIGYHRHWRNSKVLYCVLVGCIPKKGSVNIKLSIWINKWYDFRVSKRTLDYSEFNSLRPSDAYRRR